MVTKQKVANGIFWVEVPEADLRILCGCPADAVKHLIRRGLVGPAQKGGVAFETGPNAILVSDTPIQKGSFANLSEFPLLQMFYRQGILIPHHPNNTGRRPLLIGLGDQVRSQGEYFTRGNYGLVSVEELEACGLAPEAAREMFEIKKWFSFGAIRPTSELVDLRPVDADTVDLAPGCVMHRKGFNRYEFLAGGQAVEVDLTLGPGEEFEPAYTLPSRPVHRHEFSVIHVGEVDGWDVSRPCMGSIVCSEGRFYLVDAGPHLTRSLDALGIGFTEVEGIFHTHSHDDHFSGLTALVRSDRRLKYYAVPWVRVSVQKKLSALMRIDEERFSSFFEVHDLEAGAWNRVGAMEVKPVCSPHPVETTVLFCRARSAVTVLSIPAAVYRQFVQKNGDAGRVPALLHDALALCPAFAGIKRDGVLNHIAAAAEERRLAAGTAIAADSASAVFVLAHGEVDLSVGSQLIETLHPGGFWGEERIVSTAPGIASAHAATDCVVVAVPAAVLADVPSVQWELLETFERRLRSLRAGFRFEWSDSFRVNVRLLDDQHRELFARVNVLSQALGASGELEGHEAEKQSVLEYARTHFRDEEALMEAHAYPRHGAQKRAHEMLMRQLERLASVGERRARPRSETAVDYLKNWLISHTLLEDLQYRDFFAARGIT